MIVIWIQWFQNSKIQKYKFRCIEIVGKKKLRRGVEREHTDWWVLSEAKKDKRGLERRILSEVMGVRIFKSNKRKKKMQIARKFNEEGNEKKRVSKLEAKDFWAGELMLSA